MHNIFLYIDFILHSFKIILKTTNVHVFNQNEFVKCILSVGWGYKEKSAKVLLPKHIKEASGGGVYFKRKNHSTTDLFMKPCTSPCVLIFWSKMLTQELMIGKCEDAETKNSCWAKELVKISTIILQHNRITKLPVPWKIQIKVWYTPLSCFYRKPTHVPMKPADHKNIDPQLVEARRWMMLETSSWCQPIQELSMSWSCPVPRTL